MLDAVDVTAFDLVLAFGGFVCDDGRSVAESDPLLALLDEEELKDMYDQFVARLTPFELKVMRLRMGMEDGRPRTLQEISDELGLTRERVRRMEAKLLRRPCAARRGRLKDYLEG